MTTLFDVLPIPHTPTPQELFDEFHAANPYVYAKFRELALDLVDVGHEKLSISMLFEIVRWEHALRTTDPEFKLNNNLRSRYSRLLMQSEPRLAGKFEIREIHETKAFLVRKK